MDSSAACLSKSIIFKGLDLTRQDTQVAASIMDGWQQFCKEKAPFCSNPAEAGVI
jgi:Tfp pilus assembly protein PilV